MKKHIFILSFLLLASFSFAQKAQIWLSPTYTFSPKSIAQSTYNYSSQETIFQGSDTSYFNVKATFDRFDTLKFTPKISFSLGIRWEKPLNSHFSLSYGICFNNYQFNVTNKTGTANFQETERTPISKPQIFTFTDSDNKFIFPNEKLKEGTDFNLTELQIPLILNWKKTDFSIGIGAQLNSPIIIKTTSENFAFEMIGEKTYKQVKKVVKSNNSSKIKRSSIDLSANYTQWIDKIGLEIGVSRRMTNFWIDQNDDYFFLSPQPQEITTHKVNPITISLRVIYLLK